MFKTLATANKVWAVRLAIECADGNLAKAARALGCRRNTLYYYISRYGISVHIEKRVKKARGKTPERKPRGFLWLKMQRVYEELKATGFDRQKTCDALSISRRTLFDYIELFRRDGLELPEKRWRYKREGQIVS